MQPPQGPESNESAAWFLNDGQDQWGPLSEFELRRSLVEASGADLAKYRVRQGASRWYSALEVLNRFKDLAENGVYLRRSGEADREGPYTRARALEMLRQRQDSLGEWRVRFGRNRSWQPAEAFLEPNASPNPASPSSQQFDADLVPAELIEDIPEGQLEPLGGAAGANNQALHQATLIDDAVDQELPPGASSTAARSPAATDSPVASPRSGSSPGSTSSPRTGAGPSTTPPPRPTPPSSPPTSAAHSPPGLQPIVDPRRDRSRKRNRSNRGKSGPGPTGPSTSAERRARRARERRLQRWKFHAATAGKTLIGLASIAVVCWIGLSALDLLSSTSSGPPPPGLTNTSGRPAADRLVDADGSVAASDPALIVRSSGPPTVLPRALFRPTFLTSAGSVEAGTAFMTRVPGSEYPLLISALHLLGPAGGLAKQMPADTLRQSWQKVDLADCISGETFEALPGRPLVLEQARPFPESSPLGDVLAFKPRRAGDFKPFLLSSSVPQPGERVWMVAPLAEQSGFTHGARVVNNEAGWLTYAFDDPGIDLRATSGAPVVNAAGEVIAVHVAARSAGTGNEGIGSLATRFHEALAEAAGLR